MKNQLCSILYDCAEDETLELFGPLIKLIASCSKLLDQKHKSLEALSPIDLPNQINGTINRMAKYDRELGQESFQKYFTIWQIKFASLFIGQLDKKLPKFKYLETIPFQFEQLIKSK